MRNPEMINFFENGFTDETTSPQPKQRNKPSKLAPYGTMINKYWAENKSMQFICDRLKNMNVTCNRSTVWRFINKSLSL